MKKIIFFTLVFSFLFSSCSSDSDDDKVFEKDIDVTINVGETYSLDKGDYMVESVSDEFIAEASVDGTIKGLHAGEALVVMKGKGYTYNMNVVVESKNTLFTDLKTYLGASEDKILDIFGTPDRISGSVYSYTRKSEGNQTVFAFNAGKRVEIAGITFGYSYAERVGKHLADRYLYVGESDGVLAFVDSYDVENYKTFITCEVTSYEIQLMYFPREALDSKSKSGYTKDFSFFK